ncbi:unnamed protein product [Adineta ricciae]|uniref:DED domain-containing protein n=1 Tax=Adineta ricciae TaxID=249248 RepID=A0A815JIA3_ADIRI|nr:unnamed protein product [Adineta ricciae]CAF1377049.1 unnamed protein product [Adineta ricciae]
MDGNCFRVFLANLQDRLSNDERKRLAFIVGDGRFSPGSSLNLVDALSYRNTINNEDLRHLIDGLKELGCSETARIVEDSLPLMIPSSRITLEEILNDYEED